ncbi:site-specific integrase [Ligilactobacillus sp. WILCCON 0076]|uniref:Site-specific integrase n=1 Tax=Ligilactobacillus ubinensis TaxID=2876789 RepID=A0A9X2JJX7_9LACO|nr:tyrosine-type recombinase/integrase [Ligilactobacillus ubinensis]MCP0885882.1 site-specific integrase [Ligilactobacillus ubinensis]
MATFKSYKNKRTGKTKYMFKAYLGINQATGKRVETTRRGFSTKKEAKLTLDQLKIDFAQGKTKREDIKFDDLFEQWFETYQTTVKNTTASQIRYRYEHFFKSDIGSRYISKISPAFLQKIVNSKSKKYKNYKNLFLSVAMPLKYAYKLGAISLNPIERIIYPNTLEIGAAKRMKKEDNFYNRKELIEFLNETEKFDTKLFTFFRLLAFSGMRVGEAYALTWKDIDFKSGKLSINKTVSLNMATNKTVINAPKTKESIRDIYLDKKTISILAKWKLLQSKNMFQQGINIKQTNQLIFTNDSNRLTSSTTSVYWLRKIYKNTNVSKRITAHGFRHTHASLLFEAGASIKEVQARLGHSNSKTTLDIYTHVTKNRQTETGYKFAKYIDI